LLAEIRRAAAVIVLSGRRTRPASSQPIAVAATAMTARAMAAVISSCGLSRPMCPPITLITSFRTWAIRGLGRPLREMTSTRSVVPVSP
jgi:hypothetical protein